MHKSSLRFILLLACVGGFFRAAQADFKPETGFYYNPAEPGVGVFYEEKPDSPRAFIGIFYYRQDGCPLWAAASGDRVNNRFSAPLGLFKGGKSLFDVYSEPKPPTGTTSPGTVILDFSSAREATLTWPNGQVKLLQRFEIFPGGLKADKRPGGIENGWWWVGKPGQADNDEPGIGFAVETQGDTLFAVTFLYESVLDYALLEGTLTNPGYFCGVGAPVWYIVRIPGYVGTTWEELSASAQQDQPRETYVFQGQAQGDFMRFFGGDPLLGGAYQPPQSLSKATTAGRFGMSWAQPGAQAAKLSKFGLEANRGPLSIKRFAVF